MMKIRNLGPRARRTMVIVASAALLGATITGCSTSAGGTGTATATASSPTTAADFPTMAELYEGNEAEPPSSGPAPKEGIKVVYLSCGQLAPGCVDPGDYAGEAAALLGWDYKVIDGKFNAANGWANGIRQALTESPDAIWTAGIDCETMKPALKEAKAQGVPVVGMISADCPDEDLYVDVVYNPEAETSEEFYAQWGRLKADYLIAKTGGEAKVIDIWLKDGLPSLHEAFVSEIEKCAGCSIVGSVGYSSPDSATPNGPIANGFKAEFLRHPDANAVNVGFDTQLLATGLVQTIKNTPGTEDLIVIGGEASDAGLEALRQGPPPTAEAAYSNEWMGWAAIDAINRALNDATQESQGFGSRIVEKENAGSSGSYEPAIDFKSAYLKSWGIEQ